MRVMGFTLWCCLWPKFDFENESNFWLVSLFWKFRFPFDWELCDEYRRARHCADRRDLNLLTAVRPVELAILVTRKDDWWMIFISENHWRIASQETKKIIIHSIHILCHYLHATLCSEHTDGMKIVIDHSCRNCHRRRPLPIPYCKSTTELSTGRFIHCAR